MDGWMRGDSQLERGTRCSCGGGHGGGRQKSKAAGRSQTWRRWDFATDGVQSRSLRGCSDFFLVFYCFFLLTSRQPHPAVPLSSVTMSRTGPMTRVCCAGGGGVLLLLGSRSTGRPHHPALDCGSVRPLSGSARAARSRACCCTWLAETGDAPTGSCCLWGLAGDKTCQRGWEVGRGPTRTVCWLREAGKTGGGCPAAVLRHSRCFGYVPSTG